MERYGSQTFRPKTRTGELTSAGYRSTSLDNSDASLCVTLIIGTQPLWTMHTPDELAEQAEAEIEIAASQARADGYSITALSKLEELIREWTKQPSFLADGSVRVVVLNCVTGLLCKEQFREVAWKVLRDLAGEFGEDHPSGMASTLRIATFELAAEPPETDWMLGLLHSLAEHPETRWAVFAAYRRYPWRLRPHAHKYSRGHVTDADCDDWLRSEGLGDDEYLLTKESIWSQATRISQLGTAQDDP